RGGRQAVDRPAQAARGGSDVPSRVQQRAEPNTHSGARRTASRNRGGAIGAEIRRSCTDRQAEGRVPRNVPGKIRGTGEAQEADQRGRAVRRLLDSDRAAAPWLRGAVRG